MLQLIYTSACRCPLRGGEISRLLVTSRVNNEIAGITGLLLSRADAFLQVLEGEDEVVEETFARIAADPRHCSVQVLSRNPICQRAFEGWSMGFVHLEEGLSNEPAGLREIFDKKGHPAENAGAAALQLLKQFRYGPRRRCVDRGFGPVLVR